MIKLKKESAGHPDYMKIVDAEMDKEYTVQGFVDEILSENPDDYGMIEVKGSAYNFKDGKLLEPIHLHVRDRKVVRVEGFGSYMNWHYILHLEEKPKVEKKIDLMSLLKQMRFELRQVVDKYQAEIGTPIRSVRLSENGNISIESNENFGVFGFDITV